MDERASSSTTRSAPAPTSTAERRYGPAAGEPPLLADPRRWGSLIGLVGAMTFLAAYSPALGPAVALTTQVVGALGVAAALFHHYVRPVRLGLLARPRPLALVTYCGCVVGEVALIAFGARLLASTGRSELRPALVAAVVGLHFVPLAWAFHERLFLYLGGAVTLLGAAGLAAGALGVGRAAEAAAVAAGLVMLGLITLHAQGRFARGAAEEGAGAGSAGPPARGA